MCIPYWSGTIHIPDGGDVIFHLPALPVAILVLAHAATSDSGEPSLCVCNENAQQRDIVALSRAPAIAAAAAASQPDPASATT